MKNNNGSFYVYIYLDPRKPGKYKYGGIDACFLYEPFYVGKGKGNRFIQHLKDSKSNNKNKILNNIFMKSIRNIYLDEKEPIIIKIKTNLEEKESLDKEYNYIKNIGILFEGSGPLCNRVVKWNFYRKWTKEQRLESGKKFRELWKNPDYRKKQIDRIRKLAKSEEYRNKISKRLKAFWKSDLRSEELRNMLREKAKKQWESNEYREYMSKKISEVHNSNDILLKQRSELAKLQWQNQKTRKIMINNIKKSLNKPEVINQKRKITKELWKNPDYRNKIISKAGNFYEITFPNGDIKIIKNLSKFCNEHDLNVKTVTYHVNNQTIYKNYFIIKKDLNG